MTEDLRLAAEQLARVQIDRQLRLAGWAVVDRKDLNPFVPSTRLEVIMKRGPYGRPGSLRSGRALHGDGLTLSGLK